MLLLLFFIIQWYKRGAAYHTLVRNRDTLMILFSKKKLFVRKILRKTHVVICKESLESDGFCIGIAGVLLGSGFARTSLQDFF